MNWTYFLHRSIDVDEGTTVTDFLPAERTRGVTIQSAAISFHWPPLPDQSIQSSSGPRTERSKPVDPSQIPHEINLIDTPGHADFTFEVLRSLRILDGAVCILDGVAGVEAQTEKVWSQAAKYHIPKLIYINKLDRDGASFENTVKDIASRLYVWPAVCQIPWWEGGKGRFTGLGDVIGLRAYRWNEGGDGKAVTLISIRDLPSRDLAFGEEIKKARVALVELLSEHDDELVEKYLEYDEDHLAIPSKYIIASLRKCVMQQTCNIVPVLAGASFRNIGVQPLLDAVVAFLPGPDEMPDPEINLGGLGGSLSGLLTGEMAAVIAESTPKHKKNLRPSQTLNTAIIKNLEACALAFKVVNDPRRGVLVYVRVYSGSLRKNITIFNANLQISERAQRLLKMYASDSVDVDEIPAGQIGVIPGLKHTRTGDTLISYNGMNPRTGPPAPLNTLQLRPIDVPPAVFFAGIESKSLSEEKAIVEALALLVREDPSLQVSVDEESGQTLLSGMGEFHLEIAGDRLINDLKAKASMGKIEIAYRESILASSKPQAYIFDRDTGGKKGKAGCIATVAPLSEVPVMDEFLDEYSSSTQDGNTVTISIYNAQSSSSSHTSSGPDLPPDLAHTIHTALRSGALAALSRGITHSFPLNSTHVSLVLDPTSHLFGADSTPAALSSAARLATKAALKASADCAGSALLELVMNVTISVDEASLGAVAHDIASARGGHIVSLDDADQTTDFYRSPISLSKVYAPPDPFGSASHSGDGDQNATTTAHRLRQRSIVARVPLKEMVGYLKHLRKLTAGRGTFVMSADRFERVVGQREKVLLRELRGF